MPAIVASSRWNLVFAPCANPVVAVMTTSVRDRPICVSVSMGRMVMRAGMPRKRTERIIRDHMPSAIAGPRFAPPRVDVEQRADGTTVLRSPDALRPFARAVGEWLVQWASLAPDRCFLAERAGDDWRRVTYAEAIDAVRRIGGALLTRGLTAATPVAILSDNSIDHALLALGAMHVGIPVASISPAYSLLSKDHAKLKGIFDLLRPGLVFASGSCAIRTCARCRRRDRHTDHGAARHRTSRSRRRSLCSDWPRHGREDPVHLGLHRHAEGRHQHAAHAVLQPAKLGAGLAVSRRCSAVLCEWLPWNHTFGGNATFNIVLRNGGTLYIDGGKPTPDLIATTARNLREVSPTLYFNVPRGYDLLLPLLESDEQLRRFLLLAARRALLRRRGLAQNLYERLQALIPVAPARRTCMLSGWGSTETAPLATCVHFPIDRAAVVGNPAPGIELKLVPSGEKLEVRVKGPNVTPGYYGRPDLTHAAFDDEGFYKIGDAMRFVDGGDAARGLAFDGRVAEDFKIQSGTWVSAGSLRVSLIAACNPLIQDAVITGHDRPEVGALVWVNLAAVKALGLDEKAVKTRLQTALAALRLDATSSTAPSRLLVLDLPPSIDEGEITDKGYINQRAVLERRAMHVDHLHAGGSGVIWAE